MKLDTVLVKGKQYPLVVNNWALKEYGKAQGYDSLGSTLASFGFLANYNDADNNKDVPFEDLEKLAKIGYLAILEGCEEEGVDCGLKEKDLVNEILKPEVASMVIIAIIRALPAPQENEEVEEKKSPMNGTTS